MSKVNLQQAKFNMIEQQVRPWDVLNPEILDTLDHVSREDFVADHYKNLAYADTAIPLNNDQFMMHPVVEGRMLQTLEINPDDKVLEVGTGSGYITACLANLASHVDSIEIDELISQTAADRLNKKNIRNVTLMTGDATSEIPDKQSYDVIAITGSMNECSQAYKEALKIGGRLFIITGEDPAMVASLITRTDDNAWAEEVLFETSAKRLMHAEVEKEFVF
jgi:protein-L-isoaspartate(D-aspartate) O-methyltransferase